MKKIEKYRRSLIASFLAMRTGMTYAELYQETLIAEWRARKSHNSKKGAKLPTWVYTYMNGYLLKYFNRVYDKGLVKHVCRNQILSDEETYYEIPCDKNPIYKEEGNILFWELVNKVPEKYRSVLVDLFYNGYGLGETAKRQGVSFQRIRQMKVRALGILRKILCKEGFTKMSDFTL